MDLHKATIDALTWEVLVKEIDANERNIYILSGIFGAAVGLLLILVIALMVQNTRLRKEMQQLREIVPWAREAPDNRGQFIPARVAPSQHGSVYGGGYAGERPKY